VPVLPRVIPLFPLPNGVLFPGMPLPLHVFEPRYRRMVADALSGPRVIGMTLLKPGWEADYHGRPAVYAVGCAGRLEKCDPLPDGRFDILLKGIVRFRIREEHGGQPYRLASVDAEPEEPGDLAGMDEVRDRVLSAIGRAADGPAILVTRENLPHELFVNALCQSLRLTPVEQQSLLDCGTLLARYSRLLEILDFRSLERTYGQRGRDSVH
jgi:Lon protease-like protein